MTTKPLIILTAGGTGGHVFPADSLAEELLQRGYSLELITDNRGKNNYKGKLGEIPNHSVLAGALVGKSKLFKIKSLIKTFFGTIQAALILFKKKPVCVVGFGGYASFPCCFAAILLGIDLIIHEQNSVMSRTNRFLSKYAALIAQSFKKTDHIPPHSKTVLTGMPIRKAIIDISSNPFPEIKNNFQIMVLGGSQGAKVFNDIVPLALKNLDAKIQKKIKLFQQARKDDVESIKKAYKDTPINHTVSHFFENMPELYSNTHLIISRAGASSVCEILAVGTPSILVPLPIAADDHQSKNALEVTDAKAGYLIKQPDFTVEKLSSLITELFNDHKNLELMSTNAKKASITDASKRFADAIEQNIIRTK